MAGIIPNGFITELLERVDIIDVISKRVTLRKNGKNHLGLCPFHNENTPSFTVNQQKQFYYCFGCGASGDALKFIMENESLEFVPAVEQLAALAGLQVPKQEQSPHQAEQQSLRQQLQQQMQQAAEYFAQQLWQHPDRQLATDYLKKRGLSAQIAKDYMLGYADNQWDSLLSTFGQQPAQREMLIQLGLAVAKEDSQRCYDFFRQRVMFPIRDRRGKVIAFGGRVLDNSKTAKYLNSPESAIFHKGQELYGLYEAKKAGELHKLLVVEGYMDVIALAQAGIHYAVATLGTATSSTQIERLQALSGELYFCFDGDKAGRSAAWRALENALGVLKDGIRVRFCFLPEGEDPDSLVRQEGKEAFEQRLMHGLSLSEFLLNEMQQRHELDSLEGKADFAQACSQLISPLKAELLKSLLVQQIAQLSDVSQQQLTALSQIAPTAAALDPPPASRVAPSSRPTGHESPTRPKQATLPDLQHRLCCMLLRAPSLAEQLPEMDSALLIDAATLQQLLRQHRPASQFLAADLLQQHNPILLQRLSQSDFFAMIQELPVDELNEQAKQILSRLAWQQPNEELKSLSDRLNQGKNLSSDEYKRYTDLIISRKRQGLGRS